MVCWSEGVKSSILSIPEEPMLHYSTTPVLQISVSFL